MITVIENQSLLDIAIEYYGNAIAAIDLAVANNISITDVINAGNTLQQPKIEYKNFEVFQYFNSRKLKIATAITIQDLEQIPIIGIGKMQIENNFIVA